MIRRAAIVVALVVVPASVAARTVDIFIRGEVVGRVPGKNLANVVVRWDYKCFGDRYGDADYDWTLKAVRREPKPEETRELARGRTKSGSVEAQLPPGRYDLVADPFICVTSRGPASTTPEVGAPLVVPDFCSWAVTAVRGSAEVEHGQAVTRAARDVVVRPGAVVTTRARAEVRLANRGGAGTAVLSGDSRLRVDRHACGRTGGWRLLVERGRVAAVAGGAAAVHEVVAGRVVAAAARAAWTTEFGRGSVTVRVRTGSVRVRSGGRTVTVRAGRAVSFP